MFVIQRLAIDWGLGKQSTLSVCVMMTTTSCKAGLGLDRIICRRRTIQEWRLMSQRLSQRFDFVTPVLRDRETGKIDTIRWDQFYQHEHSTERLFGR